MTRDKAWTALGGMVGCLEPAATVSAAEQVTHIQLKSIFDSSGTGLALVALDGRWLRANGVTCRLLGYSEAQLQATTFLALTHPDDREVGISLIDELKRGTRPSATMHKRYLRRDGQVVWVRLTVGLVRDEEGQPSCFVSQLEDITENWQLRETLMGSELKFLSLAESSPNVIVRYDRDLLRTYVNPTFLLLTGLSFHDAIGVAPNEESADYLRQLRQVVATGEPAQFLNSWAVEQNGEWVTCVVSLTAERNNAGEVIGVSALAHDITQLRKHQDLEEARLHIFEKMASDAPLDETLGLLVGYLKLALPNRACSVMLLDPQTLTLTPCTGPGLRDEWPPTPGQYASWSEPIMDTQGRVLGAFVVANPQGVLPDDSDIQRVRQTCHIAAIAIERWRSESLLKHRERRYRDIFDHTLDMLCLLEVTEVDRLRCVEVNPALLRALGKPHGDVIGQTLERVFDRLSAGKVQDLCQRCLAAGRAMESEDTVVLRDEVRNLHFTLIPVADPEGMGQRILVISRDITLSSKARQKELERQHDISALVENSPDAIVRVSAQGKVLYVNAQLKKWVGSAWPDLPGKSIGAMAPLNAQSQLFCELVAQVVNDNKAAEQEFMLAGLKGAPKVVLIHFVPEVDGRRVVSVLAVGRDISKLRAAERRLANSNAQLRDLSTRRETAREEERKLIAREIHDELGQHLTALRMGISLLRFQFGATTPELTPQVERLMALTDKTIQVVRDVSTSLRPSALNLGLVSGLEWLTTEFVNLTRTPCLLHLPLSPMTLPDAQITAAFRIVQESLTNIARYAQATQVSVTLAPQDGHWLLEVQDNGVGFEPDAVGRQTLGLAGMRERGLMLGGKVIIFSHPGQGTTVQAFIPMQETGS
ncbi:PAS domain S-box protein [Pseudomonas sp. CBS]|uniref:PAS domain S-box protein n=1 Tax=Pseudomonas TaxID=286 RepID=UPI0021ABFCAE|nr:MULTISPECIES: PAS domain S-box protein [unclassified Pseudomonas]UVH52507.1 PAS domain S-box protein [Pseudomonas sp. CBS]WEL63965.1 PAS domain S-box protein [Pseudomonas sp. CBSPGW29]WEL81297.1 PAS domain S-box protein [Pseudomonas sp. CBSPCAW29]WEL89795.1 PAS domain S-box protein [Pseudomonas sp. CBSPCBW29]